MALASGPLNRNRSKTLLVGVVGRDSIIEGVLSSWVGIDGEDGLRSIEAMLKKSRFNDGVRLISLNGIAIAGLNIVAPKKLEKDLNVKVALITRNRPNRSRLIAALRSFSEREGVNFDDRIRVVERDTLKAKLINGLYVQADETVMAKNDMLKSAYTLLRIAHLIASGISRGESSGRV